MQNTPNPSQPFEGPGQQPFPGQGYPQGQPQSYPPQPFQGAGYPQGQQPQYPPQPYYPQQPYPQGSYVPQQPLPAQPSPNQTYVVVNNSQKVNSGCAPWVIWLTIGIALFLCAIVSIPLIGGVIGASTMRSLVNKTTQAGTSGSGGSQHHKVGEILTISDSNNSGVTYTAQVQSAQISKNTDTGNTYLLLDLVMKNTGNSAISPSDLDFTLTDATGLVANPDDLGVPQGKQFFGGLAQAGGSIKGTLAFKITSDQHNFVLTYTARELSGSSQYGWDLHA